MHRILIKRALVPYLNLNQIGKLHEFTSDTTKSVLAGEESSKHELVNLEAVHLNQADKLTDMVQSHEWAEFACGFFFYFYFIITFTFL